MILKFVLVLALVSTSAPAFAQSQPAAVNPGVQSAEAANDRVICERIQETGSRLGGKRVCKTAREWAEQRQRDREAAEDAQGRGIVHH